MSKVGGEGFGEGATAVAAVLQEHFQQHPQPAEEAPAAAVNNIFVCNLVFG